MDTIFKESNIFQDIKLVDNISTIRILMLKDTELLRIGNTCELIGPRNLLPVTLRFFKNIDYSNYLDWVNHRAIPINRQNAKKLLNLMNLPQHDRKEIIESTKGLSLTDCYWLKTEEKDNWNKVNLFSNHFSESISQVSFTGISPITIQENMRTPETTTQGAYAKCWVREEDGIYLYKANTTNGAEAETEVICSILADILKIRHIPYSIQNYEGKISSKCKNMLDGDYSIVTFYEFVKAMNVAKQDYIKWLETNISFDLNQMILFDGIVNNTDRHSGNWGFFMDNNTGDILRTHPLFDHNCALDLKDLNSRNKIYDHLTLRQAAKSAYKKLNKPQEIATLRNWLTQKDTIKLFRRFFDKDDQRQLVLSNIDYIIG